jgi:hypothetical protein
MCACVPPPLSRIARRALKARLKTLAGDFGHAPARRARPHSPPVPQRIEKDRNTVADL